MHIFNRCEPIFCLFCGGTNRLGRVGLRLHICSKVTSADVSASLEVTSSVGIGVVSICDSDCTPCAAVMAVLVDVDLPMLNESPNMACGVSDLG